MVGLFLKLINPENLINLATQMQTVGYLLLFAIVFAESGLFFGFFLPGDSLLFLAGVFASQGALNYPILLVTCVLGAVLGDSAGFAFGNKIGRKLFDRPNSRIFRQDHLAAAAKFYDRHGGKAIVLARFMPLVRTFTPIVAGVANMDYRQFLKYNLIGGLLWGVGVVSLGYFFGNLIPKGEIDKFLLPVIILILVVSVLPVVWRAIKHKLVARD